MSVPSPMPGPTLSFQAAARPVSASSPRPCATPPGPSVVPPRQARPQATPEPILAPVIALARTQRVLPLRAQSSPRPPELAHLTWVNGAPRHVTEAGLAAGVRPDRLTDPVRLPEPVIGDPTAMCCSVVQAAVEVLRGIRPLAQLTRWLAPEIFEALARRREITVTTGPPSTTRQARVRRARVVRVSNTAAEATVIVQDYDRVRAAAIRVEHLRGSWRVVAFELA